MAGKGDGRRPSQQSSQAHSSLRLTCISEDAVVNVKNKSHSVTADIVVPPTGAEAVISTDRGNIGGWSLYAKGRQTQVFTTCSASSGSTYESSDALPGRTPATHESCLHWRWPRQGVNSQKVGEGKVAAKAAMIFSADDGRDVWVDTGSPVHRTSGRERTSLWAASRASNSP